MTRCTSILRRGTGRQRGSKSKDRNIGGERNKTMETMIDDRGRTMRTREEKTIRKIKKS